MTLATTLNPMTTAVRRSYELKPKVPVPLGQSAERLNLEKYRVRQINTSQEMERN